MLCEMKVCGDADGQLELVLKREGCDAAQNQATMKIVIQMRILRSSRVGWMALGIGNDGGFGPGLQRAEHEQDK